MVKYRICSIVGSLIRHTTTVDCEIYKTKISEALIEVLLKDKNEKLRRKAVAALGEYLFYAATQLEELSINNTSTPNHWHMNITSYQLLSRILKNQLEDDLVKLYAIKTVENITA